MRSDKQTTIEKGRLIEKYVEALNKGDFEAVGKILEVASEDCELEGVILKINEALIAEMIQEIPSLFIG